MLHPAQTSPEMSTSTPLFPNWKQIDVFNGQESASLGAREESLEGLKEFPCTDD